MINNNKLKYDLNEVLQEAYKDDWKEKDNIDFEFSLFIPKSLELTDDEYKELLEELLITSELVATAKIQEDVKLTNNTEDFKLDEIIFNECDVRTIMQEVNGLELEVIEIMFRTYISLKEVE